jgi:NAD(P)-dependent dehydrogenase (short-subunit alcohol dehydrogenase family)
MGRLEGKRALITGSGAGIGRAVAHAMAAEGAAVEVTDIVQERIDEVVGEVEEAGGRAIGLQLDILDEASMRAGVEQVVEAFGGLDTLVNNGGVASVGTIEDTALELWESQYRANTTSAFLMSKFAWPHLKAAGGGSITNASSVAGIWAQRGNLPYCAAKAAVLMLTKCLALEGAADKIRVNCVCPGFTLTPMLIEFLDMQPDADAARRMSERAHALNRMGEPSEVADGYVFLAANEWVTGVALPVDGGFRAGSRWQDFAAA